MYIEVHDGEATVADADDCRSLDVRVTAGDRSRVDAALRTAGLGRWDGGPDAELAVLELRAAAAQSPVGTDWPARWDAMIDYARAKGWVTEDQAYLRAHVVDIDI